MSIRVVRENEPQWKPIVVNIESLEDYICHDKELKLLRKQKLELAAEIALLTQGEDGESFKTWIEGEDPAKAQRLKMLNLDARERSLVSGLGQYISSSGKRWAVIATVGVITVGGVVAYFIKR